MLATLAPVRKPESPFGSPTASPGVTAELEQPLRLPLGHGRGVPVPRAGESLGDSGGSVTQAVGCCADGYRTNSDGRQR